MTDFTHLRRSFSIKFIETITKTVGFNINLLPLCMYAPIELKCGYFTVLVFVYVLDIFLV